MGKTQAKKSEAREKRLGALPRSERLAKMATIKKKEGRVLDASEKHALKMTTEYGQIMRLWETLRTSTDPTADPQVVAARQKKRNDKREQRRQANSKQKKFTEEADDVSEDESEDEETAAPVAASGKAAGTTATAARTVERYEYKYPVIQELMQIITPQFASAVKTPRVSRVIQSIIKYGSPAHLDKLIALLATDFGAHCNDAFAHFVVCALIRHAPHHQYRKLLGMLVPIVPSIVSHKFGMQVMHAAYTSRLCSALDRNLLLLGVFKDSVAVMKHWRGYPVMEDIIAQELDHQKRLLQRLFDLSDKLVAQKDAFTLPYVQRLVYAFLRYGTKHEIVELSVTIKPHLAVLCDTREGATLASLAFSLLEPKARKDALRQFGERLSELVVGKYSAPVVARLFDLVYDAQLLHKYVAAGVEAEMIPILNSPYGYMILLHLLTPDDARRERVIFPAWKEHNLFSKGNASWNTHEWLDVQYKKETVELCSKPATRTHLSVLGPIVQKFIALIGDAAVLPTLNKTHVGLVARELLNSIENEAQYQSSVKLAPSDVALLKSVLPNKDQKREREATAPATEASTESVTKKSRTEASATPQRASSVKAPVSPPPRSTSKPSPVPKAPAEAPRSEKKVSGSVVRSLDRATSEVLDVNDDAPVERSARTPQRAATPTSAATPASAKKAPASAVKKSPRTPVSIARTSFKAQDATPSSASKKPKA